MLEVFVQLVRLLLSKETWWGLLKMFYSVVQKNAFVAKCNPKEGR
jgi:hypothetical protein